MNRPMSNNRRVHPSSDVSDGFSETVMIDQKDILSESSQGKNDTTSFINSSDGSSYIKLKQFKVLDPTLKRLLFFLACFGVTVNFVKETKVDVPTQDEDRVTTGKISGVSKYVKILIMFIVCALSMEVVFDLDINQSKLITEQKRSAPLLTFVIVSYSVTSLIIPIISDGFLILIGSHLFRFYSRTTATVCNGEFSIILVQ